jgi:hypothetical protein
MSDMANDMHACGHTPTVCLLQVVTVFQVGQEELALVHAVDDAAHVLVGIGPGLVLVLLVLESNNPAKK